MGRSGGDAGGLGLWEGRRRDRHVGGQRAQVWGCGQTWRRQGLSKDCGRKRGYKGPGAEAEVREKGQL